MKITNAMVVSITIIALALMSVLAAVSLYSQYSQAETIKACVASGGEWVRDNGNHYECIKVGK